MTSPERSAPIVFDLLVALVLVGFFHVETEAATPRVPIVWLSIVASSTAMGALFLEILDSLDQRDAARAAESEKTSRKRLRAVLFEEGRLQGIRDAEVLVYDWKGPIDKIALVSRLAELRRATYASIVDLPAPGRRRRPGGAS